MKAPVEPDDPRFVNRVPQKARDFLQIRGSGLRIYQIPIGVKEDADNPADEILGEFFNAMFGSDDRNEVVNKRNVLDAILDFGEADHQKIIGQPPRRANIYQGLTAAKLVWQA